MPACKECGEYPFKKDLKDGICKKCLAKRVEPVDLRAITRNSDKIITRIYVCDSFHTRQQRWITLGECKLMRPVERSPMRWLLAAYLTDGVTDFEHDSAYALRLPLLALHFDMWEMGQAWFYAIIDPNDPDEFHVPPPGYNPMEHKEARLCKEGHCKKEPHIIVPEDFYTPPHDAKLYRKVACRPVLITIGVAHEKE
jgi:hypothetical protein